MRSFALFCSLLCVVALAGAATPDFLVPQTNMIRSADTVVAPDGIDIASVKAQREQLYQRLVAARAKGGQVDLGPLSQDELGTLADTNRVDARRVLVGIARPVEAIVDLAPGEDTVGMSHMLSDGTLVWSATFRSEGAAAMRARLVNIDLPEGAALYVYGDHGDAFGPYLGSELVAQKEFWTNSVLGEALTLQVEIAPPVGLEKLNASYFTIKSIGHIGDRFQPARWQRSLGEKSFCTSGDGPINESCVYNAACSSLPGAIAAASNAIADMLFQSGSSYYICTGGLVADSTASMAPYFLTANHCISTSTEAASLETYFDFTAPCGTTACTYAWDSGRNTPGATILSGSSTADYTLLQLSSVPSGRSYLGWTSSAVAYTNGASLYRLSHPAGAPQAYSTHSVSTTAGTCSSWPRGSWIYSKDTYGATEGGSSGSPVLNASGQIVGQLSGGCGTNVNDVCDSVRNATVDGAFAAYFSNVAAWLDPSGCTPTTEVCDGIDNDCDGQIDEDNVCGTTCFDKGAVCTANDQCCSNKCRGRTTKTCR